MNAPKRIWVDSCKDVDGNPEWDTGAWGHEQQEGDEEYVRADLFDKAMEALREIADPISLSQGNVNAEIARATLEEINGKRLMKPCPKCGQQPTVTIRAPEAYEFVGSCRIHCCDHYVCADGMADAIEAWEQEPRPIYIGEIISL